MDDKSNCDLNARKSITRPFGASIASTDRKADKRRTASAWDCWAAPRHRASALLSLQPGWASNSPCSARPHKMASLNPYLNRIVVVFPKHSNIIRWEIIVAEGFPR
jgi:hypothetical protein